MLPTRAARASSPAVPTAARYRRAGGALTAATGCSGRVHGSPLARARGPRGSSTLEACARSSTMTPGSSPRRRGRRLAAASSNSLQWVMCQLMTRSGATRPRPICPATASAGGASSRTSTASRPRKWAGQSRSGAAATCRCRGTARPHAGTGQSRRGSQRTYSGYSTGTRRSAGGSRRRSRSVSTAVHSRRPRSAVDQRCLAGPGKPRDQDDDGLGHPLDPLAGRAGELDVGGSVLSLSAPMITMSFREPPPRAPARLVEVSAPLPKSERKNRKTLRMSRKIEAASSGAVDDRSLRRAAVGSRTS